MRGWIGALAVLVALLVPSVARAQDGTIAGLVRDASGAVLPGVTVEASSPVLIEKVRSATTDGTGQYSIVALPPGVYTLTFTLPGFSVVRSEGIQLTAAVTATINAELRVGALEETVTVTGESPIVDIRNASRRQVIDGDVLQTLPTSRSYNDVLQLAPGVVAGNGQAQLRPGMLLFTAHGGNTQDGRLTVDGINTGASRGGAGVSGYIPDMQNAQEVTFIISGNLGEAETGGPQMQIIPKAGGNTFNGSVLYLGLQRQDAGQQLRRQAAERARPLCPGAVDPRLPGVARRADHPRPDVVLRQLPRGWTRPTRSRASTPTRTQATRPSGPTSPTCRCRAGSRTTARSTRCA